MPGLGICFSFEGHRAVIASPRYRQKGQEVRGKIKRLRRGKVGEQMFTLKGEPAFRGWITRNSPDEWAVIGTGVHMLKYRQNAALRKGRTELYMESRGPSANQVEGWREHGVWLHRNRVCLPALLLESWISLGKLPDLWRLFSQF